MLDMQDIIKAVALTTGMDESQIKTDESIISFFVDEEDRETFVEELEYQLGNVTDNIDWDKFVIFTIREADEFLSNLQDESEETV